MKELNIKLKVEKEAFKKKLGVVDGKDGIDGKTPVKGKDYLTDKEMEKIKGELIPIPGIDFDLPEDGKDADEGKIISEVVKLIPVPKDGEDGSPDTPEQVKEKLETLEGKERLDAKAIKNLPEFVKTVSAQDAPDLSAYVPYTGADKDVDLGDNTLTAKSFIETTPTLLKLDQTTTQSVTGGAPIFEEGLSAGDALITDVLDPVTNQDAATKKYVDDNLFAGAHTDLTDMPSATDIGHDERYVTKVQTDTPTTPTPFAGMLWYDTDAPGSNVPIDDDLNISTLKVGDGGTTDYTSIDSSGRITFYGSARSKRPIKVFTSAELQRGTTPPSSGTLGNFGYEQYTIGDDSILNIAVLAERDEGTDIDITIRWACNEDYATNNGEVRWCLEWSAVPDDGSEVIDNPTHFGEVYSPDINIPTTAKTIQETTITIPGTNILNSDELGLKFSRCALIDGTAPTEEPGIIILIIQTINNKRGEYL